MCYGRDDLAVADKIDAKGLGIADRQFRVWLEEELDRYFWIRHEDEMVISSQESSDRGVKRSSTSRKLKVGMRQARRDCVLAKVICATSGGPRKPPTPESSPIASIKGFLVAGKSALSTLPLQFRQQFLSCGINGMRMIPITGHSFNFVGQGRLSSTRVP